MKKKDEDTEKVEKKKTTRKKTGTRKKERKSKKSTKESSLEDKPKKTRKSRVSSVSKGDKSTKKSTIEKPVKTKKSKKEDTIEKPVKAKKPKTVESKTRKRKTDNKKSTKKSVVESTDFVTINLDKLNGEMVGRVYNVDDSPLGRIYKEKSGYLFVTPDGCGLKSEYLGDLVNRLKLLKWCTIKWATTKKFSIADHIKESLPKSRTGIFVDMEWLNGVRDSLKK